MLFVLATSALGGMKMCATMVDIMDPNAATAPATCGGAREQCIDMQDSGYKMGDCQSAEGIGQTSGKYTCSGNKLVAEIHATTDCSDDVSTECADIMAASVGGCKVTYTIGECNDHRNVSLTTVKVTGSCPGADDEPCFSREAEACRILDTSAAPSAAFRACFDEAQLMPMAAERVKMTALTGGDYVLSAGKDQAYEFTRVIVNQHKLNEARPRHPHHLASAPGR